MNLENLNKLKDATVCVVGDIMLDRYLIGSVGRVSPEAPVPVVDLEEERIVAGGAANVAANVLGLGASVRLIGIVGKDREAAQLRDELKRLGVRDSTIVESESRPTTVKSRVLSGSHQIARVDREKVITLSDRESEDVLRSFEEVIEGCDALVISDYGKGVCSASLLARLITAANSLGITVLVDPKGVEYSKYAGSYLLTPNKKEALEVYLADKRSAGTISQAGTHIRDEYDIENLIITLGADGMSLFRKDSRVVSIEAGSRKVFDVTGAGDTVIATLSVASGVGLCLEEAAEMANCAAGCVVEDVGTTAISFERLTDAFAILSGEGSQDA